MVSLAAVISTGRLMLALEGLIASWELTEDNYCLGRFGGRRMVSARSSFNLTGSGGICFMSSGTSSILQITNTMNSIWEKEERERETNSFHPKKRDAIQYNWRLNGAWAAEQIPEKLILRPKTKSVLDSNLTPLIQSVIKVSVALIEDSIEHQKMCKISTSNRCC